MAETSVTAQNVIDRARARTDKTGSQWITDSTEGVDWVRESYKELYELLLTVYGDEYFGVTVDKTVTSGSRTVDITTLDDEAVYLPLKILRIDVAINDLRVPMDKLQFADTVLDDTNRDWTSFQGSIRWRWTGNFLYFEPIPSSNQTVRIYFVPHANRITQLSDTIDRQSEHWSEYIVCDVARKIRMKEQSSTAELDAEKAVLIQRIHAHAPPRDMSRPQTIADVRMRHGLPIDYFWY